MTKKERKDAYQLVTDAIVEKLEQGVVPWHKPWTATGGISPMNLKSKHVYRGVNVWVLMAQGYSSPYWMSIKQANAWGGRVRKGEHGTKVVFWSVIKNKSYDPTSSDPKKQRKKIFYLKYFTVFNVEQLDGIEDRIPAPAEKPEGFDPLAEAERIFTEMPNRPSVSYGGDRAYYQPSSDSIRLPERESFDGAAEFYSTAFHEMAHSTGHSSRVGRKGIEEFDAFGSEQYSKEELIAEMTAAFLCSTCEIKNDTIDNSAAYIKSWLKVLKDDKRMVVLAASAAQKAADYVLGSYKAYDENEEENDAAKAA